MQSPFRKTKHVGIYVRHQVCCPAATNAEARCSRSCSPSWKATAGRGVKPKVFGTLQAAINWRHDRLGGHPERDDTAPVDDARVVADELTVAALVDLWEKGAESGEILSKHHRPYTSRTRKSYLGQLRLHVLPVVGDIVATVLTEDDMQDIVEGLQTKLAAQTVRNAVYPLGGVYNWARRRHHVPRHCKPTLDLWLPAPDEQARTRVETPQMASALIAALAVGDRAAWSLAFRLGLRSSEIRAALWGWFTEDWKQFEVRAAHTGSHADGPHRPKSRAGTRPIPVNESLGTYFKKEWLRQGKPGPTELVCPGPRGGTLSADGLVKRSRMCWEAAGFDVTGEDPLGLHTARHTFASTCVRAGIDIRSLKEYLGHSSIAVTERYLHRLKGASEEDAIRVEQYLRAQGCA